MTGLEDRIRKVPGVVDVSVELGEAGVEGLRIRVGPGADEAAVMSEVRRVLVAYGLSASGRRRARIRRLDALTGASGTRLTIRPLDSGSAEVILVVDGRAHVSRGDRSPRGVVTALANVTAEVLGKPEPQRVVVARDVLDGLAVLTVLVRCSGGAGVGAAFAGPSLGRGLLRATEAAVATCGVER